LGKKNPPVSSNALELNWDTVWCEVLAPVTTDGGGHFRGWLDLL